MLMVGVPKSQRAREERGRKLSCNDRAMLDDVLDASPFGHVGYVLDGMPIVGPAICWREDGHVYLIVPGASRLLRNAPLGLSICLTVSVRPAQMLPRSAQRCTAKYQSAVLSGRAEVVVGTAFKRKLLSALAERLPLDHQEKVRHASTRELKTTAILELDINAPLSRARFDRPGDESEVRPALTEDIYRALRARRARTEWRDVLKGEPQHQARL